MGINDEYSRDAYIYEQAWDTDDTDDSESELDPEDWQALHSDELLNAWMTIRTHLEDVYIQPRSTYSDFIRFVMDSAPWFSFDEPTRSQVQIWNEIARIPIIRENASLPCFIGWAKNFVPEL